VALLVLLALLHYVGMLEALGIILAGGLVVLVWLFLSAGALRLIGKAIVALRSATLRQTADRR
jgi:hypothetical protein